MGRHLKSGTRLQLIANHQLGECGTLLPQQSLGVTGTVARLTGDCLTAGNRSSIH